MTTLSRRQGEGEIGIEGKRGWGRRPKKKQDGSYWGHMDEEMQIYRKERSPCLGGIKASVKKKPRIRNGTLENCRPFGRFVFLEKWPCFAAIFPQSVPGARPTGNGVA